MIQDIGEGIVGLLGLEADTLTIPQMSLRAFIVYLVGLAMVRVGEKRFLGKSTAFDVILSIVIGSVLGGAVTGSPTFFANLVAGVVLVGLHWLFAAIAVRNNTFATLIKGNSRLLICDGEIRWNAMRESNLGERDLLAALRYEAEITNPREVKEARLERSGDISVIKSDREPQIFEVTVEEGVQTVRIKLE